MRSRFAVASTVMFLALVMGLAGCTGGGSDGESPSAEPGTNSITVSASPNLVEDNGRFFAISEVGFGDDAHVLLTNFTSVQASLNGLYLCEAPQCVALPDVEIEPGAVAAITSGGGEDLEGVVLTDADLDLTPASGEIGLHASEDTESEQDIRAYLEWGSTPHEGTATAIAAGLWLEESYVNSAENAKRVYKDDENKWTWE